MKNKEALDFFAKVADQTQNAIDVKLKETNDMTGFDAQFILSNSPKNCSLLDLGTGTGLIINKISDSFSKITAVEPLIKFTDFIDKKDHIQIVNETLLDFNCSDELFDLITIFGVMHYFNEKEAIEIYQKYFPLLINGGKMIIKNQFGVKEDVTIDGYSEEQKTNYFAQYRHINKEVKILESIGFKNISVHDIYPPECNRWENTHFYAIVAEK